MPGEDEPADDAPDSEPGDDREPAALDPVFPADPTFSLDPTGPDDARPNATRARATASTATATTPDPPAISRPRRVPTIVLMTGALDFRRLPRGPGTGMLRRS